MTTDLATKVIERANDLAGNDNFRIKGWDVAKTHNLISALLQVMTEEGMFLPLESELPTPKETTKPSRIPIYAGDVVVAKEGRAPLRCGSGIYSEGVVFTDDPLVLVSRNGAMVWRTREAKDFEFSRRATPNEWREVEKRMQNEE